MIFEKLSFSIYYLFKLQNSIKWIAFWEVSFLLLLFLFYYKTVRRNCRSITVINIIFPLLSNVITYNHIITYMYTKEYTCNLCINSFSLMTARIRTHLTFMFPLVSSTKNDHPNLTIHMHLRTVCSLNIKLKVFLRRPFFKISLRRLNWPSFTSAAQKDNEIENISEAF